VREVITPYRRLQQEVQPVQEEIRILWPGEREATGGLVVLQPGLGALWSCDSALMMSWVRELGADLGSGAGYSTGAGASAGPGSAKPFSFKRLWQCLSSGGGAQRSSSSGGYGNARPSSTAHTVVAVVVIQRAFGGFQHSSHPRRVSLEFGLAQFGLTTQSHSGISTKRMATMATAMAMGTVM